MQPSNTLSMLFDDIAKSDIASVESWLYFFKLAIFLHEDIERTNIA